MASSTESLTYVVHHMLPINDVQREMRVGSRWYRESGKRVSIKSKKFSCQDDAERIEFILQADFGNDDLLLLVHAKFKNRWIDLDGSVHFSAYDHEGRSLALTEAVGQKYGKMLSYDLITGPEITIFCNIGYSYVTGSPLTTNQYRAPLQSDFIDMFESAAFADVTFVVEEEEIRAHKGVLASRSTYFKNMFSSGMLESDSKSVKVKDVQPTIFKAILRFIYGGVVEERQLEVLAKLIAAADMYCMDELKRICETIIRATLKVENIIDALVIADKFNCEKLLRDAKAVFRPLIPLLRNDEVNWNKLAERPGLLLDLL